MELSERNKEDIADATAFVIITIKGDPQGENVKDIDIKGIPSKIYLWTSRLGKDANVPPCRRNGRKCRGYNIGYIRFYARNPPIYMS